MVNADVRRRVRDAAQRTFQSLIRRRRDAYRAVFFNPPPGHDVARDPARVVLLDLQRFCHADKTVFVPGDPQATATLEGRRQVWLRIVSALNLDDKKLSQLSNPEVTHGN